MDKTHYKQMSGRAGRTGFDKFGESIMFTEIAYRKHVEDNLIQCNFDENMLESSINQYTLRRIILEIIASTSVQTISEIGIVLSKLLKVELITNESCEKWSETFFHNKWVFQNDEEAEMELSTSIDEQIEMFKNDIIQKSLATECTFDIEKYSNLEWLNWIYDFVKDVLADLKKNKFLALDEETNSGRILPTPLGKAWFASSVNPEEGEQLFKELYHARLGLQLTSDLHLWYLVTNQISPLKDPNWRTFFNRFNRLLPSEEKLWDNLDIDQEHIARWCDYPPKDDMKKFGGADVYLNSKSYSKIIEIKTQKEFTNSQIDNKTQKGYESISAVEKSRRYARFYNAFIIQDILHEKPINQIAKEYNITRGVIQNLQLQAANASGILACFWERLHWNDLSVLLIRMNERLNVGVQEELLELMQIRSLKPEKARILFNANVRTPEMLNELKVEDLAKILSDGEWFMSKQRSFNKENDARKKYVENIARTLKEETKILMHDLKTKEVAEDSEWLKSESIHDEEYCILSDEDSWDSIDESELDEIEYGLSQKSTLDYL